MKYTTKLLVVEKCHCIQQNDIVQYCIVVVTKKCLAALQRLEEMTDISVRNE